ncbi:MAG: hypothetical protein OXG23_07375, partial [Chloroflexi bacterium]|nr:hypothetical protein [Chloroflexota bacterium]
LILGFAGGLIAVLGGVWTAYRLLAHSIQRELDSHDERIGNLETRVDNHSRDVTNRLDREKTQRHQNEMEAQDGRGNLSARILVVESKLRLDASNEQEK